MSVQDVLFEEAVVLHARGNLDEAIEKYERSLAARELLGDEQVEEMKFERTIREMVRCYADLTKEHLKKVAELAAEMDAPTSLVSDRFMEGKL